MDHPGEANPHCGHKEGGAQLIMYRQADPSAPPSDHLNTALTALQETDSVGVLTMGSRSAK